jgi:integrase
MTPKVSYRVKNNTLKIRIKVPDYPAAIYDTGVYCPENKFDVKKQISGSPVVQTYMDATQEAIRKLFLPGTSAKSLWLDLTKQRTDAQDTHRISDAFDYYFRTADVEESTIKTIQAVKLRVNAAKLLDTLLKDINGALIRNFLGGLDLKDSTIHETYVKLYSVLNRYIRDHAINLTLPKGIAKRPQKIESEEAEYLVWDELKELLRVQVDDDSDRYGKDLWCLMALTGMAAGDLLKFTPKSISADGKWLHYNRKKTNGKCAIPLLPPAKEIIDRYQWPAKISIRTIQYKSEGIVSLLVGRKMKSHGARKTFGTIMLEFGYSIESVSKMMGHSNPLITAQIYSKVTQAKIEREMQAIPDAVKKMMNV